MLVLRAILLGVLAVTLAWGLPAIPKNDFNRYENLATIFSERLLPSPDRTAWFAAHGMPATPDVRALAGSYATRRLGDVPIRHNKRFFRWLEDHGTSVYLRYLLTHPGYLFALPIRAAVGPGPPTAQALSGTTYGEIRAVLPGPVEGLLFGGSGELMSLTLVVAVLVIFAFGLRGWTRRELVPGIAVVLSLILYWLTFHGAASELARHNIVNGVAIRMSLQVLGILAVDRFLTRRATQQGAGGL